MNVMIIAKLIGRLISVLKSWKRTLLPNKRRYDPTKLYLVKLDIYPNNEFPTGRSASPSKNGKAKKTTKNKYVAIPGYKTKKLKIKSTKTKATLLSSKIIENGLMETLKLVKREAISLMFPPWEKWVERTPKKGAIKPIVIPQTTT